MRWLFSLLLGGALMLQPAVAKDDGAFKFSADDFGVGSSVVGLDLEKIETAQTAHRNWEFYGFLHAEMGHSFAKEGDKLTLAKMSGTLNLTVDYKFNSDWRIKINGGGFYDHAYQFNGRENYTAETLDAYESEAEFRDTFVEGGLGAGFSIKVGRQILAWGESDSTQINDMANPRDNREIGMVELEDARIPIAATLISWNRGDWRVDAAALHEYRANKIGAEGSEFDPLAPIRNSGVHINEVDLPENGGEWTGRIIKSFNGSDVGLYASETYNDSFYMDFESLSRVNGQPVLSVTPKHQKIKSFGLSGNKVIGSLLVKVEMARKEGMLLQRSDVNAQVQAALQSGADDIATTSKKDQTQQMLGLEYMGVPDLTLTLEVNRTQILDWEVNLETAETSYFTFSSVTHTALHDTLTDRLVWMHYADQEGDIYRWTTDYDLMDGWNIAGGIVWYRSSKEGALLEPFKNNDRVTISSRYSF